MKARARRDLRRFTLDLSDGESRLLVRAALAGLKGARHVQQDAEAGHTLVSKIMDLASEIIED